MNSTQYWRIEPESCCYYQKIEFRLIDLTVAHLYRSEPAPSGELILNVQQAIWDKEVLGDVTTVVDELADGATLEEAFTGWETEYEVTVGKNRPRLDAYKDGVGIEHEAREQMNMRSHLLFADAMFQQGDIEVLVVIIPAGNDASKRRTANELHDDIFTEHHPLDVPVLVIEYDRDC